MEIKSKLSTSRSSIREKIPEVRPRMREALPSIPRPPTPDINRRVALLLFLSVAGILFGGTSALAGLFLIVMMAVGGEVFGVVGASAMVVFGLGAGLGGYLWLTGAI